MRDTNLHYKDCSEMHSGSCSQMMSSCKCSIKHFNTSESDPRSYEVTQAVTNKAQTGWMLYQLSYEASLEAGQVRFIDQSVEHRTGIAEVMGSNPVGASEFFLNFICNCLSYFITARSLSLVFFIHSAFIFIIYTS